MSRHHGTTTDSALPMFYQAAAQIRMAWIFPTRVLEWRKRIAAIVRSLPPNDRTELWTLGRKCQTKWSRGVARISAAQPLRTLRLAWF